MVSLFPENEFGKCEENSTKTENAVLIILLFKFLESSIKSYIVLLHSFFFIVELITPILLFLRMPFVCEYLLFSYCYCD